MLCLSLRKASMLTLPLSCVHMGSRSSERNIHCRLEPFHLPWRTQFTVVQGEQTLRSLFWAWFSMINNMPFSVPGKEIALPSTLPLGILHTTYIKEFLGTVQMSVVLTFERSKLRTSIVYGEILIILPEKLHCWFAIHFLSCTMWVFEGHL